MIKLRGKISFITRDELQIKKYSIKKPDKLFNRNLKQQTHPLALNDIKPF